MLISQCGEGKTWVYFASCITDYTCIPNINYISIPLNVLKAVHLLCIYDKNLLLRHRSDMRRPYIYVENKAKFERVKPKAVSRRTDDDNTMA